MMNVKDLRIGNYVVASVGSKDWCQVTAFDLKRIDDGKLKCFPIPLTAQTIMAAGFVKNRELEKVYRYGQWDFENCYGAWGWTIDDRGDNEGTKMRFIKYVHELQNLYFAIEGTELHINI